VSASVHRILKRKVEFTLNGASDSAKVIKRFALGENNFVTLPKIKLGRTYVLAQPISLHPIMVPRQKENSTYMIHIVKKMDITSIEVKIFKLSSISRQVT